MKLLLPELRKEAFDVVASIKNIKEMHSFQLDQNKTLEELRNTPDQTDQFVSELELKYIVRAEKFITDILGLSVEEVSMLEALDKEQFMIVQTKIILTLQGYDQDKIDKIFIENDQNSKK